MGESKKLNTTIKLIDTVMKNNGTNDFLVDARERLAAMLQLEYNNIDAKRLERICKILSRHESGRLYKDSYMKNCKLIFKLTENVDMQKTKKFFKKSSMFDGTPESRRDWFAIVIAMLALFLGLPECILCTLQLCDVFPNSPAQVSVVIEQNPTIIGDGNTVIYNTELQLSPRSKAGIVGIIGFVAIVLVAFIYLIIRNKKNTLFEKSIANSEESSSKQIEEKTEDSTPKQDTNITNIVSGVQYVSNGDMTVNNYHSDDGR